MFSSNAAAAIVADPGILWAHLLLLLEIESIGETLAVIEQQYGVHPLIEDTRHRQQRMRIVVLEQLRGLLAWAPATTVH